MIRKISPWPTPEAQKAHRMTYIPDPAYIVGSEPGLVDIVGVPRQLIAEKSTPYVTPLVRQFILRSPYFLMATADDSGRCDCTPRGDPAGMVHFLDDRTLVIADRKGNRRVDSMRNILQNPHVGLLFLVPGTDETVRVNGTATHSAETPNCVMLAMQGKPPPWSSSSHEEVFTHCARFILRSRYGSGKRPIRNEPDMGRHLAEQRNLNQENPPQAQREYRQVLIGPSSSGFPGAKHDMSSIRGLG